MPEPNYSLSELNRNIRSCLEHGLPGQYWVRAETSEVRINPSGHCYLELIEKGPDNNLVARIKATIWAYEYHSMNAEFFKTTGLRFDSGMSVMVLVKVTFHELFGMSLNIKDIDPSYSLGEMARLRQACIDRLKREGLMDLNKHQALPVPLRRIAIISSPTAAGYQDFMQHLCFNPYGVKVYTALYMATMQGKETTPSVVSALDRIAKHEAGFDAIVIIRGGGAVAELQAFDDYTLAAAVARTRLPVFTGIGHDRDVSVTDMVAFKSFKTPTAVADYIVESLAGLLGEMETQWNRLLNATHLLLAAREERLQRMQYRIPLAARRLIEKEKRQQQNNIHRLNMSTQEALNRKKHLLNVVAIQLPQAVHRSLDKRHERLRSSIERLPLLTERIMKGKQEKLAMQEQAVKLLNPKRIMQRGFSVVRADGHAITQAENLHPGMQLNISFASGTASSSVIEVYPEKK